MKKNISIALLLAMTLLNLALLSSCDDKEKSTQLYGDGSKYNFITYEVVGGDEAMPLENGFTLNINVCNPETNYDKATLEIIHKTNSEGESLFTFTGADESGKYCITYEDFGSEKYKNGICETIDFECVFDGEIEYYALGKIVVIFTASSGEEEDTQKRIIQFATDGKNLAFCDGLQNYFCAYNKLPDNKPELYRRFLDPRRGSASNLDVPLVPYMSTDIIIKTAEKIPIGEAFDMQVGVGTAATNIGYTDFALVIRIDGFEISDKDGNCFSDEYYREYEQVNVGDFSVISKVAKNLGSAAIYTQDDFDYRESIRVICTDKSEHSGEIFVEVRGLRNGEYLKIPADRINITIYYATDGKYIAYSVESEDAAKRALYGNFGYFFKVTLPECFTDLFGGD